jgi:hypothetical protein
MLALGDASIAGEMTTPVVDVAGGRARGTFVGELRMVADHAEERGRRSTCRPFRGAAITLVGDLEFSLDQGVFVSLRLASAQGVGHYVHGKGELARASALPGVLAR